MMLTTVAGKADFNSTNADACGHTKSELFQTKYVWAIDNFSFRQEETGVFFKSPVFTLDLPDKKVELAIRVYPKGRIKSCEEYVSAFVYVISKDISINAKFKLGVINRHGCEKNFSGSQPSDIWKEGSAWGHSNFILRSNLYDPKSEFYISSDRLIVFCEFFVACEDVNIHYADLKVSAIAKGKAISDARPNDYNKGLFVTKKFSDLALVVDGKTVKAHKNILASKSSVFADLITDEMTKMEMEDLSYEGVVEFLRYIYTGEVETIDSISRELLLASIKYELEGLKGICHENLISKMDVENVVDLLMFAHEKQLQELEGAATIFLKKNAKAIKAKANWLDILDGSQVLLLLNILMEML